MNARRLPVGGRRARRDECPREAGLPAASGVNSLTLTGSFNIAATSASEDSSLTQPQDEAAILLSAFLASVGTSPPSASHAATGGLSAAELHHLLRHLGAR